MLSLASKRTALITRHSATSVLARQQRARLATTEATTSSSSSSSSSTEKQKLPIVISRRAWLEFKESNGITKKRPDASKRPLSDDEKPWPRNMQIAGYVAGAVAVPYIVLWTITSNPTLREWFGPYIPLDKLRTHYGKLEHGAQNWSEEVEAARNKDKNGNDESESLIGYYQFPEEAPFKKRREQQLVEAMNGSDVQVTLSLLSPESSLSKETVTQKISARTVANTKSLMEYLPSNRTSIDANTTVAVEFLNQTDDVTNVGNSDALSSTATVTIESPYDDTLMTDTELMTKDMTSVKLHDSTPLGGRHVAKDSQTTSKWAYVPSAAGEGSNESAKTTLNVRGLTDAEIQISRWKYEIAELEKNLRDPMCTRSIDDLTTELRQAKKELFRLTWKNRFGFSR